MRRSENKRSILRMRWYELAAAITTLLALCSIITFTILHMTEVYKVTLDICMGLLALITFSQSVQNWRKKRKPALICLGCGILCALFSIFVYFAV